MPDKLEYKYCHWPALSGTIRKGGDWGVIDSSLKDGFIRDINNHTYKLIGLPG